MNKDNFKTLESIRRLALEDLDGTSDDELRQEVEADGRDVKAFAHSVATELDTIVAAALRDRMLKAKARAFAVPTKVIQRPAIDRLKELIKRTFAADPGLATAFRDGARQSEQDIQSLYDDLVRLGKIDAGER